MAQSKIRASEQIFFDADVNINSKKLTSVAEPTADQDAATKSYVDSKVRGLDWSDSIIDQDLSTPPGTPNAGDRYIVKPTGTGAWSGHNNEIAQYNGSSWEFDPLNEGVAVWVEDENVQLVWNGTSWALMGAAVSQHGLVSATHTVSGLTTGHFLKALSATTFGFEAHGLSYGDVGAEQAFSKNTGFNKNFGTSAGNVAEGNHNHSSLYEPLDATILKEADVDDIPVDGVVTAPISSNWAFDHETSHANVLVDGDIGVAVQAHSAVLDATTASFLSADETKLDAIEALADVTSSNETSHGDVVVDGDFSANGFMKRTGAGAYTVDTGTYFSAANSVKREIPGGVKNGSNVTFTLANTPSSGTECLYVNGMLQNAGASNDYTITGLTITMAVAPISTDTILANYNK